MNLTKKKIKMGKFLLYVKIMKTDGCTILYDPLCVQRNSVGFS